VNHMHYQAVWHNGKLPIETMKIGSDRRVYGNHFIEGPVCGNVFGTDVSADELWHLVSYLQERGIPLNLIMIGDRVCVIPRDIENEVVSEFPSGVIASMELCGKFIISDFGVYGGATAEMLETALRKTTYHQDHFWALNEKISKKAA